MSASVRYIGICSAEDIIAARAAIEVLGYGSRCFSHELFDSAGLLIDMDDPTPPDAYACDWASKGSDWPAIKAAVKDFDVEWFNEGSLRSRRASNKGLGRIKALLGYRSRGEGVDE